ncbi:MAG: hypothetical protein KDA74_12505 [Planctomycetaceae bacterium]|nr:hypothetical protein [Planctomycetaceae bacterium]
MDLQLERELYERFLHKEKVDRFLWMLKSPERRERIFDELRDTRYFNEESYEELSGQDKNPTMIIDRLKKLGVRNLVYVISSDADDDGTEQVLEPFINTKIWQTEEVLGYCKKSKVGFFKNHEGWFYLLCKSK